MKDYNYVTMSVYNETSNKDVRPLRIMSPYLTHAFYGLEEITEKAKKVLSGVNFDTLIGIGLSGSLVIPHVAQVLDKHFFIVRKEHTKHSKLQGEGTIGNRWVFFDDCISSGDTFKLVYQTVEDITNKYLGEENRTRIVGTYQYSYSQFDNPIYMREYYKLPIKD